MKIGPKYKIARRLQAPVFEKTQTAKYSQSLARKERSGKLPRGAKSEYGLALTEKQKARYTYLITEKQFRGYVDQALRAPNPAQKLFALLESRLDNALYRAGFAKTRAAGKQIASHGHALVNGRRVTVPSIILKAGDKIGIREGSAQSPLFAESAERMKNQSVPAWLKVDPESRTAEVAGVPAYEQKEHVFDLGVVIEFYNR